ncbi:TRAP transporter permease [Azospirillum sp. ST 5-10]|uniref:TRAP transporter permease n=1 Tax=unclassified Azospirillum TaxID=2630922 RepID=UPI003F49E0B0
MTTATLLYRLTTGLLPLVGLAFVFSVPNRIGWPVVMEEYLGAMLGLATCAVLLRHPVRAKAGWADVALGLASLALWLYMAARYEDWIVDAANRPFSKWGAAAAAIALLLWATWRSCGRSIAILFAGFILYGVFGHLIPGPLQAFHQPPEKLAIYLFADSNGIPGSVLRVICTVVLVFVIFGQLLDSSGASKALTDLSMSLLGGRRGGPAKVAILASAAFGSINGTTVGNIISTGVVTIPLMKRNGFRPEQAGAIEAVASNGGQLAPPIMGTTAFLIADFLQIDYAAVVVAALIPAILYFLGLYLQVDAIALRRGLHGLKRSELPALGPVARAGWIHLVPIALLVWLMIGRGYQPTTAGIYASLALLALTLARVRRAPGLRQIADALSGSGESLLTLVVIGGGAGIAIGVLTLSGLGFQLAAALAALTQEAGLFATLVVTAVVCIILGMGMPTSAVYIVLSIILAPSIVEAGVDPLAAHLFLFYFGMLSMVTPPVAVASYVAASMAQASMWATSVTALRLSAVGFFVPFLWVFNPALIAHGTWGEIALAVASVTAGTLLIALALSKLGTTAAGHLAAGLPLGLAGLGVGTATLWLGPDAPSAGVVALAGFALAWYIRGLMLRRHGAAPGLATDRRPGERTDARHSAL